MSNPAGTIATVDINNAHEAGGRMVREDNIVVNMADLAYDERFGISYINGKQQGTVFGTDAVISQETAQISGKWDMGLDLSGSEPIINTTGYVQIAPSESVLEIHTGADAAGSVFFSSRKRVRYEPGTPIFGKYTAAFPAEDESNGDYIAVFGFGDGIDIAGEIVGQYQRRLNGVFDYGFYQLKGGVELFVPYNGEMPDDISILNIHRVEWGFLGVAPFNIYFRDVDTRIFNQFHRQLFKQALTSVRKPDLPVCVFIQNRGNTNDLAIKNGSFEAGTINGGTKFDPAARQFSYERVFTGVAGTDNLIFAFRNPETVTMYDSIDATLIPTTRVFKNSIASQLLEVGLAAIDNNKIIGVDLFAVPQDDILSGTFTPVELGASVLSISEDAAYTLANARKIETFLLAKDDVQNKFIQTLDLLFPGETAVFVYTTTSVNFDFNVFIKYQDLF